MAQANVGQRDFRNALLRIPRFPTGVRRTSDLIKSQVRMMFGKDFDTIKEESKGLCGHLALEKADELTKYLDISYDNDLKKYFDSKPPFQFEEALITGSYSEGISIFPVDNNEFSRSDVDKMCILKNITFSEEDQECGNLTVKEDTPFVNAFLSNKELIKIWEEFIDDPLEDISKRQLSSKKLKSRLHENYKKVGNFYVDQRVHDENATIGDGPSLEVSLTHPDRGNDWILMNRTVSNLKVSCDIVLAIRCNGWPLTAREWLLRDRVSPEKELIQKIYREGFYIVAKESSEGNFRLSFSNAETMLIENFSPLHFKVVRAFKAIIKYYRSTWSPKTTKIICSYYLKTLVLWNAEKFTEDSWNETNLVNRLLSLLDEFAQALRKGYLPMYFLPKYNLLGAVEDLEEMKRISDKVVEISKNIPAMIIAVEKLTYWEVSVKDAFERLPNIASFVSKAKLELKDVKQRLGNFWGDWEKMHIDFTKCMWDNIPEGISTEELENISIRDDMSRSAREMLKDDEFIQDVINLFNAWKDECIANRI